jgi:hypothetical protein
MGKQEKSRKEVVMVVEGSPNRSCWRWSLVTVRAASGCCFEGDSAAPVLAGCCLRVVEVAAGLLVFVGGLLLPVLDGGTASWWWFKEEERERVKKRAKRWRRVCL